MRNLTTCGNFTTEAESVKALDDYLAQINHFNVYREVTGELLHPRYDADKKNPRIDRILVPKPTLERHGWAYGCVGIECKKSGKKLGRPISQALDYSRAVWAINATKVLVFCKYIFIWPLDAVYGSTSSIMAQHNIGCAFASHTGSSWDRFVLQVGGINHFQFFPQSGEIRINEAIKSGSKTGSR